MSKHPEDFESKLHRLGNRPRGRFARAKRTLSTAEEFCLLVEDLPQDAALSLKAMKMICERFNNPSDASYAYNAIQYLFEHQPRLITRNRSFGLALAAIIHNGYSSKVKEILKQAVRDHPKNIAANASIVGAFEALITYGEAKKVGALVNSLASRAPYELADNSSAGLIIAELIKAGNIQNAVDTFIILAKLQPTRFSGNKTLQAAIDALESIDAQDPGRTARIFGEDKALVLAGHITEMATRSSRNLREI